MTTVTPTSGGSTTANTQKTNNAMISSDFQTFLKLITTQIQNQDPTDPMESSEFAVQLATFSQVEQQVKTNDLLSSMASQFGLSGISQYASWVGMVVQSETSASYDGATAVPLSYQTAAEADQAILVVTNASGAEVARIPVSATAGETAWDGTDGAGAPLPAGSYSFAVESYSGGDYLSSDKAAVYNRIVEARSGENGISLLLENGQSVSPADVTALRAGD